jgi:hypothetical protein
MSLPLHGKQGIQRSFAAALRFKSSISLQHQGVATQTNTPANPASTHSRDTSDETSLYDPTEVDPFKHEPSPSVMFIAPFLNIVHSDVNHHIVDPVLPSDASMILIEAITVPPWHPR